MSDTGTWVRLRDGTWGVRLLGSTAVSPGTTVTVRARSGRTQTVVLEHIVWRSTDAHGQSVVLARVRDTENQDRCVECGRPAYTYCARCGVPLHKHCADAADLAHPDRIYCQGCAP